MATALLPAGISTVGSLVGGGKAASAQNQQQQEANNLQQQSVTQQGQSMQFLQSAISSYLQTASPAIQNIFNTLASTVGQMNGVGDQQVTAANAATNYGSSPMNQQLAGWNGLKPEELSALTSNAATSGNSDIKTAQSRGAFGANANAGIQDALEANRESSQQAAINIGSNASQQEVGALESANNAALGGIQTGLGGLNQAGGTYGSGGQLYASGATSGLSALNPLGTGAGAVASTGTTQAGQSLTGSQYAQNNANAYGNPYAPAVNNAANLGTSIQNGKGAKTPAAGIGALAPSPAQGNGLPAGVADGGNPYAGPS